ARRSDAGWWLRDCVAALQRPLAPDPAPLTLGETAPDAELLAVGERVLEAVLADLASPAHRLGLAGGRTPLGEKEVGVDAEAVGVLLPPPPAPVGRPVGGDQRRQARRRWSANGRDGADLGHGVLLGCGSVGRRNDATETTVVLL